MKLILDRALAEELAELYRSMEAAYDQVAVQLGHGCDGCPDNCCDSYFTHHTYIEWPISGKGLQRCQATCGKRSSSGPTKVSFSIRKRWNKERDPRSCVRSMEMDDAWSIATG